MLLCLRRGSRQFQVVQSNPPKTGNRFSSNSRLGDREGSTWFGALKGLNRLFYSPVATQELSGGGGSLLVVAPDANTGVWVGGTGPLYRVVSGMTEVLP